MEREKTELSDRLMSVANMVEPGSTVCDVGCDHGFLSIWLVRNKNVPKVIASDVRKGPLSAATEHVRQAELEDIIDVRLSDGLHSIKAGEAEILVIAGMGGPLMLKILSGEPAVRDSFRRIIIEPQSQLPQVRMGLREQRLYIIDEDMVYEDGKFYPVMCLVPETKATAEDKERCSMAENILGNAVRSLCGENADESLVRLTETYGKFLILRSHPVFIKYLDSEYNILNEIHDKIDVNAHAGRLEEVKLQLETNRLARTLCEQLHGKDILW